MSLLRSLVDSYSLIFSKAVVPKIHFVHILPLTSQSSLILGNTSIILAPCVFWVVFLLFLMLLYMLKGYLSASFLCFLSSNDVRFGVHG